MGRISFLRGFGSGSGRKLGGNLRHMGSLEPRAFQFDLRRLAGPVPIGDGGSAIRRTALDFIDAHLALECIGQTDNGHAMVQECGNETENGRFLTAVLGGCRGKGRADLADELPVEPKAAGLVPEVAHLRGNRAETCAGTDDDGVIFGQFIHRRYGCRLIHLEVRGLGDFFRNQFGNALYHRFCAGGLHAFGNCIGHFLNMAVGGIIEYQNLRHSLRFLCWNCFRRTGDKLL
ncbi:LysR Family Transcriptional Regulator [Agrobacterium tumefaciens]|nr:LysR Family Transcriptional Regulator [Agrobacterium tumefaciens]